MTKMYIDLMCSYKIYMCVIYNIYIYIYLYHVYNIYIMCSIHSVEDVTKYILHQLMCRSSKSCHKK